MSEPTPTPPPGYTPNPDRSRVGLPVWAIAAIVAGTIVFIAYIVAYFDTKIDIRPHIAAPVPVVQSDHVGDTTKMIEYNRTTSTGGSTTVKGNAVGPSMALSGDKVSADDLHMNGTGLAMDDIGSVTAGSFQGSFRASSSTTTLLQIAAGILGVLCLGGVGYRLYRAPPIDINHTACLAVAGVALIVGAFVPSILAWIGLGAICLFVLSFVFPSTSDKLAKDTAATLGKLADHLPPTVLADTLDKLDTTHSLVVAKAQKKRA